MRPNWKVQIVFLVLLMVPTLLASSGKPPLTPAIEEPSPDDFTLHLEPHKTTYVLYEPVFLTATLTNPTIWPIIVDLRSLALIDRHVKLSVQEGDGEPSPYYSGIIGDSLGTRDRDVAPFQSMVETLTVFFNDLSRNLAFPRPGDYTIHGKVFLGNDPDPILVYADPVHIDVVEPGVADAQVIESLGSEEDLITLLRRGPYRYCEDVPEDDDCFGMLRGLPARFPDSVYLPSITINLATSVRLMKGRTAGDYYLEAEILQEFLSRWPGHPLMPAATRVTAYALHMAGSGREAMEWVERFESEYPNRRSPREMIDPGHRRR